MKKIGYFEGNRNGLWFDRETGEVVETNGETSVVVGYASSLEDAISQSWHPALVYDSNGEGS